MFHHFFSNFRKKKFRKKNYFPLDKKSFWLFWAGDLVAIHRTYPRFNIRRKKNLENVIFFLSNFRKKYILEYIFSGTTWEGGRMTWGKLKLTKKNQQNPSSFRWVIIKFKIVIIWVTYNRKKNFAPKMKTQFLFLDYQSFKNKLWRSDEPLSKTSPGQTDGRTDGQHQPRAPPWPQTRFTLHACFARYARSASDNTTEYM